MYYFVAKLLSWDIQNHKNCECDNTYDLQLLIYPKRPTFELNKG